MKSSVHSSGSWNLLTLSLALLFALPFFSLIVTAGSGGENVWGHLLSTVMPGYLKNTFWLMLGVGSGTLLLGVSTGWLISMTEFPGRRMMEWALLLPLAFPGYIIAMVYVELLEFSGPVQEQLRLWFDWQNYMDYWFPPIASLGGAITMLSLVLFPYVYLLARTAFLQQSATLMEASRMLDKSAGNSFFMIALPLARPAIVVGVSLAMMETLADFGTMQFICRTNLYYRDLSYMVRSIQCSGCSSAFFIVTDVHQLLYIFGTLLAKTTAFPRTKQYKKCTYQISSFWNPCRPGFVILYISGTVRICFACRFIDSVGN